jgi:hypothetical protein
MPDELPSDQFMRAILQEVFMVQPDGVYSDSGKGPEKISTAVLEPRDLLAHLRQWLISHRELHTRHFGESDQSGHPHGYAGVVIPEWDVRQRLDEIEASILQEHSHS